MPDSFHFFTLEGMDYNQSYMLKRKYELCTTSDSQTSVSMHGRMLKTKEFFLTIVHFFKPSLSSYCPTFDQTILSTILAHKRLKTEPLSQSSYVSGAAERNCCARSSPDNIGLTPLTPLSQNCKASKSLAMAPSAGGYAPPASVVQTPLVFSTFGACTIDSTKGTESCVAGMLAGTAPHPTTAGLDINGLQLLRA